MPADVAPPKKALRSSPDDRFRSVMVLSISISQSKSRIVIYRLMLPIQGYRVNKDARVATALSGQVPE
jgi:hypothetical protein